MTASERIRDTLIRAIRAAKAVSPNPYSGARFEEMMDLEIDARGNVGELFVSRLLQDRDYSVVHNARTNPQDKQWDIKATLGEISITAEIKTATMGKRTQTFQHENLPRNRECDILALIDIAPDAVYGTIALPSELPWDAKESRWTATPKKMTLRKDSHAYKWTLTIRDVQDREITTPAKFHSMWDDAVRRLALSGDAGAV